MRVFDEKIRGNLGRYLFQCLLATVTISIVFLFLDVVLDAPLVASLGATSFIVFAMPKSQTARPRSLLGGYLMGTFSGTLCSLLATSSLMQSTGLGDKRLLVVFGAIAVGLATFGMVITDTEHPPAAGLALGFVVDRWDVTTILLVLSAVGLLTVAKWALRRVLLDLV